VTAAFSRETPNAERPTPNSEGVKLLWDAALLLLAVLMLLIMPFEVTSGRAGCPDQVRSEK